MKKNTSRRQFLNTSLKAGVALPILGSTLFSCKSNPENKQEDVKKDIKPLNILLLGGTSFIGPHQIAYAMERGHKISTFTRGKTKPTIHQELFKDVEQLIGDRKDNLEALKNRKWDAVIDNSGHDVEWTKATAELLKDHVGLYVFTSSTGVYYPYLGDDITEETKTLTKEPDELEHEDMKLEYWYGVMKTNSEKAAQNAFGMDRTIVVRPTYMMGPADKTNRFIHWPVRFHKPGPILVPGKVNDPVQFIDVRDVAQWMIRLIEDKQVGTYNAVGPEMTMDIHEFAQQSKSAYNADNELVFIDDYDFLEANKVPYLVPWIMPTGNNYGSARASNAHGIANGLTYTDFNNSMQDTYEWWISENVSQEMRDKFEKDEKGVLLRESTILEAWKATKI